MESNKNGTALWKNIVIGVLTICLSIGGAIYTSGKTSGQQEEKVAQLEAKMAIYTLDHDILIRIGALVETNSKDMQEVKEDLKELKSIHLKR